MTVFDNKDKQIIKQHLITLNYNICNYLNREVDNTDVFENYMTTVFRALPNTIDLYDEGIDEYRVFREHCSESYFELLKNVRFYLEDDEELKENVVRYIKLSWVNTWRNIMDDDNLKELFNHQYIG